MPHRIPALLAAAVALAALTTPPALGEEPRTATSPLGKLVVPRALSATDGSVEISSQILVETSAAKAAGARYVLVSAGPLPAGKDGLSIPEAKLEFRSGKAVPIVEASPPGKPRVSIWVDVKSLPPKADIVLRFVADVGGAAGMGPVGVETLVMAYNETYKKVIGPNGRSLQLQTFTNVSPPSSQPAPDAGLEEVGEPEEPEPEPEAGGTTRNLVPGAGVLLVAGGTAIASLGLRRRGR